MEEYDREASINYIRMKQVETKTERETYAQYDNCTNKYDAMLKTTNKNDENRLKAEKFQYLTEYESEYLYPYLYEQLERVSEYVKTLYKDDFFPVLGTIQNSIIEAHAYRCGNVSAIIVSRALISVFVEICAIVCDLAIDYENSNMCIRCGQRKEEAIVHLKEKLASNKEMSQCFVDNICYYIMYDKRKLNISRYTKLYDIKNYLHHFIGDMIELIAAFIVAHEYAHLYYQHPMPTEISTSKYADFPAQIEIEADEFAINYCTYAIKNGQFKAYHMYWQIGLILMVLDAINGSHSLPEVRFDARVDHYIPYRHWIFSSFIRGEYFQETIITSKNEYDNEKLFLGFVMIAFGELFEQNINKIEEIVGGFIQ